GASSAISMQPARQFETWQRQNPGGDGVTLFIAPCFTHDGLPISPMTTSDRSPPAGRDGSALTAPVSIGPYRPPTDVVSGIGEVLLGLRDERPRASTDDRPLRVDPAAEHLPLERADADAE